MSLNLFTRFFLIYALIINCISFAAYGIDKAKAKRGAFRTPEKTLLGLAAAFGSPGALLGMKVFRHKTRHTSFVIGVPLMMILQIIILFFAWKYKILFTA